MNNLEEIKKEIIEDEDNRWALEQGYEPLYTSHPDSKIAIIGQAPGVKAQESGIPWDDKSGDNLLEWMDIPREQFYDEKDFAIIPMDFYYPGKGKSGDLPPRKNFTQKWHPKIFKNLPNIQLKLLVGSYAQKFYIRDNPYKNLTLTVKNYTEFLDKNLFPLVHPSPRNLHWRRKNSWFKDEVIPRLRKEIQAIISKS
jgi:uracil-DNA glycosylase